VGSPFPAFDPNCDCGCTNGACCPCPCCPDGACPSGGHCCPTNRFYGSAEYLLWWIKGDPLPPLVTTSVLTNRFNNNTTFLTGATLAGALDDRGTRVEFGGTSEGVAARSGVRGTVGWWLCDDHLLGIEASGFVLGDLNKSFRDQSAGDRLIARPFFDPTLGRQNAELVAGVGDKSMVPLAGSVDVRHTSSFWGAEANVRCNVCCGPWYFVDLFAGYRQLGLDESLNITERGTFAAAGNPGFVLSDRFAVQNRFYGGQVGAEGEARWGAWSLNLKGKVALGTTQQVVDINGSTQTLNPMGNPMFPASGTTQVGLLAGPFNSGRHTRSVLTYVPEVGLTVGYQFTNHLRATLGYNFLYWNSVARPGTQIDFQVDRGGTQAHPSFTSATTTDLWAQGVTAGLEFRW
jgi:hypothetical protein